MAGAAIVAVVLVCILPAPPIPLGNVSNFGQLMLLSLVGPILFVWGWGLASLGATGSLVAVAIPVASIATLWLGFVRRKSCRALVCAVALWSGFGGFAAFVAATGSV
jgi:hypothetical protein